MKDSFDIFLKEIDNVIHEVEQEYLVRKKGVIGNGSEQQLISIMTELKKIKHQVETNTLPLKNNRYIAFPRYIVDEWDLNSALGIKLCGLADKYERKL